MLAKIRNTLVGAILGALSYPFLPLVFLLCLIPTSGSGFVGDGISILGGERSRPVALLVFGTFALTCPFIGFWCIPVGLGLASAVGLVRGAINGARGY